MKVLYKPAFVRRVNKLSKGLQEEVLEKIDLLKNNTSNSSLKIHPLHGKFKGLYSFSVNYYYRIVFKYISKDEVVLLDFGDHDIYK